jgi:hypothetical protein
MTNNRSTGTLENPSDTATDTEATHPIAEAGKEAGESVSQLAERATDVGIKQADRGREQAASRIEEVAQTIRRVSTDMQGEQPQVANVATTAAEQAERVAQYLRQTDTRQMIGRAEDAARRQPLLFLGGAFLLGVAASRFFKAAGGLGDGHGQRDYRSGYGSSYEAGTMTDYRTGSSKGAGSMDTSAARSGELGSEGI